MEMALGLSSGRKPAGDDDRVDDRIEARFGRAEQEPADIELRLAPHECHETADNPPTDHDPGNPDPGAVALGDQRPRHLEEDIAQEENPRAHPENLGGKPHVPVHGQCRVSHVDPVEVGDDRGEEEGEDDVQILAQQQAFHKGRDPRISVRDWDKRI